MIGRHSSSSTESLVPLKGLGGSPDASTDAITRAPTNLIPPQSQSCFFPTSDMRGSMSSSSTSSPNSSNRSLMELLGEYQRRNNGVLLDRKRRVSTVEDRHIVVFDEAKMTRRIEKDIKRGRLTRVRSSDSFLEGKVEMSRRMVRSYLCFGYESGASLDKLSRQLQKHDRTRSSFNTVGESSKAILAMNSKNEMFDQIDCQDAEMLRRASAAASAGRALLSR